MSRTHSRTPDVERVLQPARRLCPACGQSLRIRYENRRRLVTLSGTQRLRLKIRRCEAEGCARFRTPDRPEAEGALALAQHEFGLDVMALVGALRHRDHRSVPEIHALLRGRGVLIAERSVTNLLDRSDEVVSTRLGDPQHLRRPLGEQEGRSDAEANGVRGYARAVRSAITDDGRAPLDAAGLRLKERLEKVAGSRRVVDRGAALDHVRTVARRYRPGLFHAPDVAGLPRTNTALEQRFGSQRDHERRATGRKTASPGAVLRGSVRLVAGIGTRARILSGRDLGRVDRSRWRDLRRSLDDRRQARVARTRFRRDPEAYLTVLERQAQQPTLPA